MSEGLSFYILDTETNGIVVKQHEINELSIIRCSDRVQYSRQIRTWYPERSSYDALRICGKTLEDLAHGMEKKDLIEEVNAFFAEDGKKPSARCVVAHNASFDMRFVHELWKTFNTNFPASLWLDSIALTKRELKSRGIVSSPTNKVSLKLTDCIDRYGLKKYANMHSAKIDTRATYNLFSHLMSQKVDYVDLIKNIPHLCVPEENDGEDMNDMIDDNGEEIV